MSVTIRAAIPDDARAIAEVHVASWRWAYRDDLPEDTIASRSVDVSINTRTVAPVPTVSSRTRTR